jgi:hypothetical protein
LGRSDVTDQLYPDFFYMLHGLMVRAELNDLGLIDCIFVGLATSFLAANGLF